MRKTYGAGYPQTLSRLLEWSGRDASAPAVTDATATLTRGAFQDRVLRVAGGLRNIQTLMLASGGKLWTAGEGLVAYTADGQSWTTVGSDADALGSDLSAMIEAPDGSTWLGDYEQGISVFANGAWRHLQR